MVKANIDVFIWIESLLPPEQGNKLNSPKKFICMMTILLISNAD